MQPDQTQYPIDYLNQIAPQPAQPNRSNRILLLIIGIGIVLTLIVGVLSLLNSRPTNTIKLETLAARLQTLQSISSKSQKTIKNGDLRSTNSTLSLFLTNANRDIVEPLTITNTGSEVLNKEIVARENGEELTKALEDARLNAVFDRTYAREMTYQLETVAALMKEIYTSTKSQSLKRFLETTDANLQPIKKQFADFNATNS